MLTRHLMSDLGEESTTYHPPGRRMSIHAGLSKALNGRKVVDKFRSAAEARQEPPKEKNNSVCGLMCSSSMCSTGGKRKSKEKAEETAMSSPSPNGVTPLGLKGSMVDSESQSVAAGVESMAADQDRELVLKNSARNQLKRRCACLVHASCMPHVWPVCMPRAVQRGSVKLARQASHSIVIT